MDSLREPHLCWMKWYEKLCTKTKTVISGGKRSKATNKAKPFENTNKNP